MTCPFTSTALSTALSAAALLGLAIPAQAADPPTTTAVAHSHSHGRSARIAIATTFDQRAANVQVGSRSSGNVPSARGRGSFQCVVETRRHSRVRSLPVLHSHQQGAHYYISYLMHVYRIRKARFTGGHWTSQFEACVTGGAETTGHWDLRFVAASETARRKRDVLIGFRWGSHVTSGGTTTSSLAFGVNHGGANVEGSTSVTEQKHNYYTGSLGPESRMTLWPRRWRRYNNNRVTSFYENNDHGSKYWQGNNGQALYEVARHRAHRLSFGLVTELRAHCGNFFGIGCGKL